MLHLMNRTIVLRSITVAALSAKYMLLMQFQTAIVVAIFGLIACITAPCKFNAFAHIALSAVASVIALLLALCLLLV